MGDTHFHDSENRRTSLLEQAHHEVQNYALHFALRLCHGDADLAREVVQDAWLSLWECDRLTEFDGEYVKKLLLQHVEWRFIDMTRREKTVRRGQGWKRVHLGEIGVWEGGVLSLGQLIGLYRQALRKVGIRGRKLRIFQLIAAGHSFQEVSEAFGVSVATIGRDVSHLREAMGKIL